MKKFLITILSILLLFTFSFGNIESVLAAENDILSADTTDDLQSKLDAAKIHIYSELVKRSNGKPAITIHFEVKSDAEIAGIEVFRSVGNKKSFSKKPVITTSKGQYNNTSVKIGKKYYYKVRAYAIEDGVKKYTGFSNKAYRTVKKKASKKMTSPGELIVTGLSTEAETTQTSVEEATKTVVIIGGFVPSHTHSFVEQSGAWKCSCGETVTGTDSDEVYVKVSDSDAKVCALKSNGTYKVGKATISVNGNDITYTNKTGNGQSVVIKTNGQNVIIDAPLDDVVHNGTAGNITVKSIAQNSYHGNAEAGSLIANGGHIEINATVTNAKIESTAKTVIDVKTEGTIDHVDINSVFIGATEEEYPTLNVEGAVTSVELNTGKANIEVAPGAKKVPQVHLGSQALAEYEDRIAARAEKLGTYTDLYVRFGESGEIVKYQAPILNGEHFDFVSETSAQSGVTASGKNWYEQIVATYTEDIYIWGDFARVAFYGCDFKGNVYNMGEEQTLLRFFFCNFDDDKKIVFKNSGRNMSVDDLLPKVHFIYSGSANAVADNCNAAVVNVADTFDASNVKINDAVYKTEDIKDYLDERASATNRTIQKYEGQPVGIHYVGQFMQGDKTEYEIVELGEPNVDDGTGDIQNQQALYSYVTVSGTDIATNTVVHTSVSPQSSNIFNMSSFTDVTTFTDTVTIIAPYNHFKATGFEFKGDVVIYGIYTDVIFEDCKFDGNVTYITDYAGGEGAYAGGKIKFENCRGNEGQELTAEKLYAEKTDGTDWATKTDFIVIENDPS